MSQNHLKRIVKLNTNLELMTNARLYFNMDLVATKIKKVVKKTVKYMRLIFVIRLVRYRRLHLLWEYITIERRRRNENWLI